MSDFQKYLIEHDAPWNRSDLLKLRVPHREAVDHKAQRISLYSHYQYNDLPPPAAAAHPAVGRRLRRRRPPRARCRAGGAGESRSEVAWEAMRGRRRAHLAKTR